ncbi:hypothetical protein DPMN_068694 [Dreissena polymorpha]|uniref:Uncharacterized protein n=1 Tax=Dreissena polymorpha TaxID=45954 RepID=A0A9D4BUG1_DREPO|nr:hypothetical protein DPMN_068694 [Dreissena polymorpha]
MADESKTFVHYNSNISRLKGSKDRNRDILGAIADKRYIGQRDITDRDMLELQCNQYHYLSTLPTDGPKRSSFQRSEEVLPTGDSTHIYKQGSRESTDGSVSSDSGSV